LNKVKRTSLLFKNWKRLQIMLKDIVRHFQTVHWKQPSGQFHAPAALYLKNNPSFTPWMGNCSVHKTGRRVAKKRKISVPATNPFWFCCPNLSLINNGFGRFRQSESHLFRSRLSVCLSCYQHAIRHETYSVILSGTFHLPPCRSAVKSTRRKPFNEFLHACCVTFISFHKRVFMKLNKLH